MHTRTTQRDAFTFLSVLVTAALACGLYPSLAIAQSDGITPAEILEHAGYLCSDELEGRRAGQRGAELAASYIAEQLDAYGYDPLGESWQLPFYVRGGATDRFGEVGLGRTVLSTPTLVQPPSYSPAGVVRASVTTDTESDFTHQIVALDEEPGVDERQRAANLIARGAVGVIFLRQARWLDPAPPAHNISFTSDLPFEELMQELDESTRRLALESVRLEAPVVGLSGNLRDAVLQLAADGGKVSIEVRRLGRDESTNVAGILVGADPVLRNEYVIVCGHYDHLGLVNGEIYPGADDNASGTSAVLEIAEAFATLNTRPRRSVVVIAWGAEEMNMLGSKDFCRNPPINPESIAAVINLDMVGRNDPEAVQLRAASNDLHGIAAGAARRNGFTSTAGGRAIDVFATDTAPFVRRGVPSLSFHTGLHPDYNSPRDTVDRLDIDKIVRVARTAFETALEVANSDERPEFTEVETDDDGE